MGEIRFVGTGETCGYPYLVCKKELVYINWQKFTKGMHSKPSVQLVLSETGGHSTTPTKNNSHTKH